MTKNCTDPSPKDTDQVKSIDLFCGIGGLTLGLERAGFHCLGGVDHWEDAGKTFGFNIPHTPFLRRDITTTKAKDILEHLNLEVQHVDIIVGGPPCQGFSTLGKRSENDPRNQLWTHYLEIVKDILPAYILIENVEGMNVMKGGSVRDGVIEAFQNIGYNMKSCVLRSADYGVPQLRKRIVFMGWLPNLVEPSYPLPTHTPSEYLTVRDAIFDLPRLASGQKISEYDKLPLTAYQKLLRGTETVIQNHEAAKHPTHLIEVLSHIPDGGNRQSIPDHLQPKSGFHNSYARLASDKPAIAVTSNMRKPSSARSTHPTQNRGLTVREGLRLQTFPDSFIVQGSRSSQYLQVGNAVPPRLAEAIGIELIKAFRKNNQAAIVDARTKLYSPKIPKKHQANQSELFSEIS